MIDVDDLVAAASGATAGFARSPPISRRSCSPPVQPARPRGSVTCIGSWANNVTRWPARTGSPPTTGWSQRSHRSRSYGPALGIATCLPDCDVTKPGELTADALDAACTRIDATLAFGSPAALANVVATATSSGTRPGLARLRVVFSAGAPVPSETLHDVARLAPIASLHTPYGMTEALPIADIDLVGIDAATVDDPAGGVCVGPAVQGASVRIVDPASESLDPLPAGQTGEILVAAPWVSDGYLNLWANQAAARPDGDDGPASAEKAGTGPATSATSTRWAGSGWRDASCTRSPRSTAW